VRRFVLVSSIKALGEANRGRPFQATDVPQPEDVYGRSKLAAEQALTEVCQGSPMGPVIVRPPLVYGPGVRANFLRIMRLVDRGVPLPLAGIDNRRSMISLDNLVDFLALCRESPAAVGRTWLVSDGDDLSSPELVRRLARAMQRRPRLLAVPVPLLRLLGRLTGFGGELQRLTDSLSVSIEPNRELLGWHPPVSVETGLRATVDAYLQRK
jgi:nucleoside-diphosphate-sugar epimerase